MGCFCLRKTKSEAGVWTLAPLYVKRFTSITNTSFLLP